MHDLLSRQAGEKQVSTGRIVAVTGGTGFIGRALIRRLLQAGFRVKALRRPTSRSLPVQSQGLTWIEGDLQTVSSLHQLVADAAAIIHCAGSVRGKDNADFAVANIQGVAAMVQVARVSRLQPRFLLLSSLAAKIPELSCYAASKRGGEDVLRAQAGDLAWTILRPPAVYGPGDRELLPLLQWLRRGLLFTPNVADGRFSLIFIDDLVRAVLCWLQQQGGQGESFELHDGAVNGYSWAEIRAIGADLFQRPVRRVRVPLTLLRVAARANLFGASLTGYAPMLTPGKVAELCHGDWLCDNTRLSRAIGWRPEIDFAEGLRRTLADG